MVYKALNGLGPAYITDMLHPYRPSDLSGRLTATSWTFQEHVIRGEIGPLVRPHLFCGTASPSQLECQPHWDLLSGDLTGKKAQPNYHN